MDIAIAAAGAGKTTWLVSSARGRHPSRVLALTFSRAQGADLAARLSTALGGPPAHAGTLHAWALALVERHGAARGWRPGISVYGEADEAAVALEVARDLGYRRGNRWTVTGLGPALKGPAVDLPPGQLADAVRRVREGARLRRRSANALTYDELLAEAAPLVAGPAAAELRAGLDLVLVDEAQDLEPSGWAVIDALAGLGLPLALAGDPRQAIYGWRGADPAPLLAMALEAAAAGRLVQLRRCWRCAPPILAAADALIVSDPGAAQGGRMEAGGPAYGAVEVRAGATEEVLPDVVRELLADGFAADDMAVLGRTNAQVGRYRDYLRAAGLEVAEQAAPPESCAVEAAALRLAANPADEAAYLTLAHERGWDARRRARHRAAAAAVGTGPWAGAGEDRGAMAACGPESTAGEVLRALAALRGVTTADGLTDETRRVAGLLGLSALGWPAGRAAAALADAARAPETRAETTGIETATIHGAKGREWPAVIVPGWVEGALPHRGGDLAEERRLAYVAMTRARERLVLLHRPREACGGAGPSRFLGEAGLEPEEKL